MGLQGQHIPKAPKNPRYIIPTRCLEVNRKHMRHHPFICRFIGLWPMEEELEHWIQYNWQTKGEVDLRLGLKFFFTVIFSKLEDKARIFEGGSYFLNNVGLYIRH